VIFYIASSKQIIQLKVRKSYLMKPLFHILLFFFLAHQAIAQSNDHMFPATAAARASIDYDSKGFLINGKRTFLVSAGLEYARIPHQLWYDRLLRLKRAGFNCVEVYTFWNFHEPKEGMFDFSGDHDLDAFLKVVKQLDMYSIVRVGPYYCAEWDFGGYPVWLKFKENMLVRSPDPVFEKYVDRFFDKLIPIVATNQINHGGSVVLVQLENEHPLAWGTYMPNDYFRHLQSKAVSLGLQVPYFFSGLHHGSDPAGNRLSLDNPGRPNPWFTTEFWSVWYDYYGSTQKDADTYGRRTWKIIARGGNGYNYYMAHGGTNFGYSNNNEDAASYDYGAAVGQTGDLRPIYYQFKRNAFFARTFQQILENSTDAGNAYHTLISDTSLRVNGRRSAAGDIIFVDNPGKSSVTATISLNRDINRKIDLAPGEIFHIVHNFKIAAGINVDWSVVRILGSSKQNNTTTLVVYGKAGSNGFIRFSTDDAIKPVTGAFVTGAGGGSLDIKFNGDSPVSYVFKCANQIVRVLAVSDKMANYTWFLDVKGKNYVVTGPQYIADAALVNNRLQLKTEKFWNNNDDFRSQIFSDGLKNATATIVKTAIAHEISIPFTAGWQVKNASAAADVNFTDESWLKSKTALQMGADGDLSSDAWYRTQIDIAKAGLYKLKINKGGDRATVFVDGATVVSGHIQSNELKFKLTAGKHQLAIFTAHDGRDKLFGYQGPLQEVSTYGLLGDIILQESKGEDNITDWKVQAAGDKDRHVMPAILDHAAAYTIGKDAYNGHKGYAWFQAGIPYDAEHHPVALDFGGIDDNAVVFVNGKRILSQDGFDIPFTIPLDGLLRPDSTNLITLLIQNTDGPGGISQPVEVVYEKQSRFHLTDWSMKGGPGDYTRPEGWEVLNASDSFDRPVYFKNKFLVKNVNTSSKSMYRVTFEGLGHGSVWINDHNIGRYPEKIPVNSLYIPECWLNTGENTIVVYDEDGKIPGKIKIGAELKASRDIVLQKF
jgi:beta-galactosidase